MSSKHKASLAMLQSLSQQAVAVSRVSALEELLKQKEEALQLAAEVGKAILGKNAALEKVRGIEPLCMCVHIISDRTLSLAGRK